MTDLAATARQWLGVPYSWPAPDGDDSDCADFVNAVSDWLRRDGGGSCVATTSDRSDPRLTHGADTEPKGMAEVYLVLSDDERAKGFIRPVRRSYRHQDPECGAVTTMGAALAETYARTPSFYGATYCAGCRMHRPVGAGGEFTWMTEGGQDTAELVGT